MSQVRPRADEDRLKVLLVEDNPADARLVREMLRDVSPSPTVTHAVRLNEAVDHLRTEGFNAVLLDLTLPDSNGIDTFARARSEAPHAPIVVLTGLADEALAARAVREGAQDYLIKGQVDGPLLFQSLRYAVERHASETALRQSEQRYRQLAENIKEAFIVIELPTFKVLYLSHMWEEIWGRPVEHAYEDSSLWLDAIHPDDRANVVDGQRAIQGGESFTSVFRVVRPDGSTRWARGRLFPVLNEKQEVYRMVGLIEDITEVRHTEEQLVQAQKMEAVGRLAGGIAHDFNNLLTVILGYSDFLAEDLGADHRSIASVNEIRTAAQSAERLTRQLLAFSRRQILQPQSLDLNDVLHRVDGLLRRVIGEDVALHMTLRTPLPRVNADPGQIEQVIMNLAVNARDAMPNGGRLTIETAAADLDEGYVARHTGAVVGPHVMVAVSDTGHGMDDATQKRLFEPFFTTKEAGKGTGLGLATAYGIVKQSQGSIWVYSEVGRGSTFKIYLPATSAGPSERRPERVPPGLLWGTETILVVEDQAEARSVIRETIHRRGYVVLEAANGAEALQISQNHVGPIHALVTDVVMPGMSGRRVAELLQSQRPNLRVIYMSGYTDDAIVHHGVLEEGISFVQKPFTAIGLLQKIREALDAPQP